MKDIKMEMFILDNFKKERLMEKEITHGIIRQKFMMGNGLEASDKVMVYGKIIKVIHIWVSGKMGKQSVMEYLHGKMVINMKENGF